MIEVRYFEQYIRDDGTVENKPPGQYDAPRRFKEFRLEVALGGLRLSVAHRESCTAPYVEDSEFNHHIRNRLASMVGRNVEDLIREQL